MTCGECQRSETNRRTYMKSCHCQGDGRLMHTCFLIGQDANGNELIQANPAGCAACNYSGYVNCPCVDGYGRITQRVAATCSNTQHPEN